MTITFGDVKKLCKEKGVSFRAASLFGASKNDSGKCDCFIETEDKFYAVKFITLGKDAKTVYFNSLGGKYVSVKGDKGMADFMWVAPKFDAKASDKAREEILLLDSDVTVIEKAKNAASTVSAGAKVFGAKVYTPSAFVKLF